MSEPVTGIAPAQRSPMRWIAVALVLLVVIAAIVLPLININRYHHTIADSLSRSLGRPVHLGSVQLQLLPRPGLALTDFVVEEDPGFGAEPLLRAPSVTVSLRPSSLWRDRLEVSRICPRQRQRQSCPRFPRPVEFQLAAHPGCAHSQRPNRAAARDRRPALPLH